MIKPRLVFSLDYNDEVHAASHQRAHKSWYHGDSQERKSKISEHVHHLEPAQPDPGLEVGGEHDELEYSDAWVYDVNYQEFCSCMELQVIDVIKDLNSLLIVRHYECNNIQYCF